MRVCRTCYMRGCDTCTLDCMCPHLHTLSCTRPHARPPERTCARTDASRLSIDRPVTHLADGTPAIEHGVRACVRACVPACLRACVSASLMCAYAVVCRILMHLPRARAHAHTRTHEHVQGWTRVTAPVGCTSRVTSSSLLSCACPRHAVPCPRMRVCIYSRRRVRAHSHVHRCPHMHASLLRTLPSVDLRPGTQCASRFSNKMDGRLFGADAWTSPGWLLLVVVMKALCRFIGIADGTYNACM